MNGMPKYPELSVIVPMLLPLHAGATKVEASTTSAIVDVFVTPLSPLKNCRSSKPAAELFALDHLLTVLYFGEERDAIDLPRVVPGRFDQDPGRLLGLDREAV